MSQHSQPVVPFNALKPATWGSLKLLPLALRSKFTGAKGSDDVNRVAFGKENAQGQPGSLQAPPRLGDLSHLHALGPRRTVNQRYVLQPNLNVSRPTMGTHAPGLSGLLLPAMTPIATQHSLQQPDQTTRQQTPLRARSSTPHSPSLRGRQQQANPNFVPPASNISTRLPTPVRINASPGPSPTSIAPMLPKPPSPSRSVLPSNPFASTSACSSPAASTAAINTFMLPTPPSILSNGPPARVNPVQQGTPRSTPSPVPWASTVMQSSLIPASVRPSPPVPERSILASVNLPSQQQQRSAGHGSNAVGASALVAAIPGHSEWLPAVAAPAPSVTGVVSPVVNAPAIQAALQQALQGAVERKPEAFRVDNFERFFESMMHPGDVGKLDGPLPHELADDIRYSDTWYKHCRDWNAQNKLTTPYSAPPSAAPVTPASCRLDSTPFAAELRTATEQRLQTGASGSEQQQHAWCLGESPLSDACCKALDIAHHGLRKVLTPTARSQSASDMTGELSSAAGALGASAPSSSLLQDHQRHQAQSLTQTTVTTTEAEDQAASRAQDAAQTAAALTTALETLSRDQVAVATASASRSRGDKWTSPQRPPPDFNAQTTLAQDADSSGTNALTGAAATVIDAAVNSVPQILNTGLPPTRRRFNIPALLLSSLDPPLLPRASGATLSPAPDSARPPSTAATTPGPRTPSGGGAVDSTVTTAATTPVGKDAAAAATTPTTATAQANMSASPFCVSENHHTLSTQELEAAAAAPLRRLSQELAAAESVTDLQMQAAQTQTQQPRAAQTPTERMDLPPFTAATSTDTAVENVQTWSPGFPPAVSARASPAHVALITNHPAVGLGPALSATTVHQRPPSPVTLLQNVPREMPTPNPSFFNNNNPGAPGAGPSSLAAAVTEVAALGPTIGTGMATLNSAGPTTSTAPPAANPLKEIVVGIEKLSTLKRNILAEDKEVDVASITQMIQLKLAVEQLLARTSSAVQNADAATSSQAAAIDTPQFIPAVSAAELTIPAPPGGAVHVEPLSQAATPKKQSRTATFGAFLKSVFSPRSGSASKAQAVAVAQASGAVPISSGEAVPASPSTTAVGIKAPRPMSASALPRQATSPNLADKSRYAALHQRAAARLAEAAVESAGTRPAQRNAPAGAAGQVQRGGIWQRYEEKIAMHRHQLDTTKAQLDEAVRRLNDMQTEFDELLLCLGMESAKNKALCDAMRAAGIDPEPILAAIEEQWMNGGPP